jgi:2-dehydropantoate 2-reductase
VQDKDLKNIYNYKKDLFMSNLNIGIIGPGSIGLLFSGFLLQNDVEITLIDHRKERAEELNKSGIIWEGLDAEKHLKIPVSYSLDKSDNFDMIFISVKAYHTEIVAKELEKIKYEGVILTLQNGVGNVEILKKYLPGAQILAGITSEGANIVRDGHVRHAGRGKTFFGEVEKGRPGTEFLEKFLGYLKNSGLDADIVPDVESLIWSKLIINVGINALTAILKVQNGQLVEISYARKLMGHLVEEAVRCVKEKGLQLPYSDPIDRVEEVCRLTAANYSSMYQDIKFGRKTEIDFINGAIVEAAKDMDIDCPFNQSVTSLIKSLEVLNKK